MAQPETDWSSEHSRLFEQHEESVRGYIRYEVTRHNLKTVLSDFLNTPKVMADIGGGKGQDALWLADTGAEHRVFLFEPDQRSASEAESRSKGRIEVINGDAKTALSRFGPESFDLIMFHGVLQYLPDPAQELKRQSDLLKSGGYLSTLNANMLGKLNRYQRRGDLAMVDRLRLTGKFYNNLNVSARAFLPQELEAMLNRAGFELVDWFGVRILSDEDPRMLEEIPAFHLNRLLESEIRASADPTLRPRGQLLHHIVRKV